MSSAGDAVSAEPAVVDAARKPAIQSTPPSEKVAETGNHVSAAAGDEPAAKKAKTVSEENGEVKEKTPKKKVSQLERTRAEAEALIGDLKKEGTESGGRRTRSQTRGTPAKSVVIPDKPARSPRTPKAKSESPAAAPKKTPAAGKSRGRPAKKAAAAADDENGAAAAADAAYAAAPADAKSDSASEKAEPAIAENGQKSSDSQDSVQEKETNEKTEKPEAEEQKVAEKVIEPSSESAEKAATAEAEPAAAVAAATE